MTPEPAMEAERGALSEATEALKVAAGDFAAIVGGFEAVGDPESGGSLNSVERLALAEAQAGLTRTLTAIERLAALAATPPSEGEVERPQDFEPLVYGSDEDNAADSGFWPYTVAAVGPARVIYHVLHPDPSGGYGFAIKENDEQAVAIAAALIEAGYLVPSPPPGEPAICHICDGVIGSDCACSPPGDKENPDV